MRFLPNENWFDVLQFVPFKQLHRNISLVSGRFSALSQPLLDQLCPRVINQLIIKWDEELGTHQLELITVDKTLHYNCSLPFQKWPLITAKCLPFPITAPPPNIIGFKEIHVEGCFDRKVLDLLAQCRPKISCYNVNFEYFDSFIRMIKRNGIEFQQIFQAIGNKCNSIRLANDKDSTVSVPAELFECNPLQNCACLEVERPRGPIDLQKIIDWLKWPLPNGKWKGLIVRVGHSEDGEEGEEEKRITDQIRTMVNELITEHSEVAPLKSRFMVLMFEVKLTIQPFDDVGSMELCRWSDQDWSLISNGEMIGEADLEEEEGTLIRVKGSD